MTVASAWSFLDPHFRALRGLLVVEDEPRLDSDGKVGFGRDSETDWWIGIKWFDLVTNNLKTRNRIVVLRRVREALLLTSLLAHIDNSLWIQKLRKLSGFELAPFMEITNQQLRPNFQLLVAGTGVSTWELTVQYLCGIENYSETFIQDMERAVQLAGGIYEYSWRPHLQLHGRVFHVDPQFGQFDLEAMNGIDSVILNLQAATNQASRSSCPSFVLSSLVLNMEALSQDSDAIEILRRIIEYGITVESIRLPDGSGVGGDWESPAWREAWIRLVCSLCCLPSTPASSSTKVKKITISADLVYRADFLLLCSALLHARSVQYLAIEGRHDEPNPVQASFPPSVWHLLCLALISRDSTTSIESLSVRGISINTENVDEVFDMTAQWFPLNAYYIDWVPGGQTAAPSHNDPTVVNIPVGTLVQGHYGIQDEPYSVVTDSLLQGIVVDEDENSVHVLIFGRGFCSIARSALPEERIILPRIRDVDEESTSLLKSIELTTTPDDTTSEEELIEFVTYGAGRAAQSLRLQIPNLGEEHVHAIFEMCPNLQHLAIGSVALPSMNVFQTAIDTGVPLRYLELNDVVVPNDSLKEFLWRYCGQEDGPSTPTLPNLRLGPVSDEILEELESLIAQPYGLRHLEYTIVLPDQRLFERLAKRNHGRSTGLISQALPNNVKLAFLGCMARLRRLSPQLDVTDEIKSLICTYAATPQTRTVVCSSAPFRQ